jgi:hypothetical protein
MADRNRKVWLALLGNVIVYFLFVGWVYLGKYANGVSVILMFAIFWLIAGGLKIAEWRRTWPFRPLPPLLELPTAPKDEPFRPTPMRPRRDQAEPAYRDNCIALRPTKTRREFAEEYRPYNDMPEFSDGTMAYLAGNRRNPYPQNSVQAQAWDRGRECCRRYEDQEGREEGGRPW